MLKITFIISMLTVVSFSVVCQGIKDTVVSIKDVNIVGGSAIQLSSIALRVEPLWDLTTGRNLSDALSESAGAFIKNYGVGQLSSITVNGASAAQTSVLWNGIKINNPSTGIVDFSLFDLNNTDRVYLRPMGSESSIGGKVILETEPFQGNSERSFKSDNIIRYGSFNTFSLSTNNACRIKAFTFNTRFSNLTSDNNFSFKNYTLIGSPTELEPNAAFKSFSFLQGLKYEFKANVSVGIDFWLTDADRHLPPVMTATTSAQRQYDQSYRTVAYIKGAKKAFRFSFNSGYIYDHLRYTDPYATIDSRSATHAFRNIFTANYTFKEKFVFELQPTVDFEKATSTGYADTKNRNIEGAGFSFQYKYKVNLELKLSLRQELINGHSLPFGPSIFWSYFIQKKAHYITLNAAVARAYRVPSMNDLYWSPGGNPNLKPEHSWNSNASVSYNYNLLFIFKIAGFCTYSTDWIQWHAPSSIENPNFWTVDNLPRVLSRGFTINMGTAKEKHFKSGNLKFSLNANYAFTRTTSLDISGSGDNSKGKQLIYVPLHSAYAKVYLEFRNFYVNFGNGYTSERFTTTDNSISVRAYYTAQLEFGKNFLFAKNIMGLSFRINNLTNTQYQVVELRPMPGRNFEASIKLNLAK